MAAERTADQQQTVPTDAVRAVKILLEALPLGNRLYHRINSNGKLLFRHVETGAEREDCPHPWLTEEELAAILLQYGR